MRKSPDSGGLVNGRLADLCGVVVRDFCRGGGSTQGDVAEALGVPSPTLNNYLCGHRAVPAWVVVGLVRLTGDERLLEEVVRLGRAGRAPGGTVSELFEAARGALREGMEAVDFGFGALADGRISGAERAGLVGQIDEAVEAYRVFRDLVEEGVRLGDGCAGSLAEAESMKGRHGEGAKG